MEWAFRLQIFREKASKRFKKGHRMCSIQGDVVYVADIEKDGEQAQRLRPALEGFRATGGPWMPYRPRAWPGCGFFLRQSTFNAPLSVKRQPGSAFTPFV